MSNSHLNVYACLVCGKYFQGRARGSPVYFHSLEHNHHVPPRPAPSTPRLAPQCSKKRWRVSAFRFLQGGARGVGGGG